MKQLPVLTLVCFLNIYPSFSQRVIRSGLSESIRQISTNGIDNILSFQNDNSGMKSIVVISQQNGDKNRVSINQQSDQGQSNQSYSFQLGNLNELSINQIGSGNLLLGFQLGYLSSLTGTQKENPIGVENGLAFSSAFSLEGRDYAIDGEGNKMNISQNGNNNGVMAVQQGTDNILSAEQTGNNNYLLAFQQGSHNLVTDYKQANESKQILLDKIVQVGDYLSLKADGASTYKPMGNTFMQTGSNLSLEVNSSLLNTVSGVEINQTGKDMKIVVDQSYFSFPMR